MTVQKLPKIVRGRVHTAVTEAFAADGRAVVSHARNGQILTHEGDFADHSLLLLEGWIALSKTLASGETQIIDVMLPGDFTLVGTRIAPMAGCTVEALSDIDYINIRPEMANGPDLASADLRELLAASILTTQSRTSEMLLRLGRGNAASRIAYALIEFHTRLQAVGRTQDNGFDFPITQQKLGEFTGMTNVHVCRTLRRFERERLIAHRAPHWIELLDMHALCALAEIDIENFRDTILIRQSVPAIAG